MHNYHQFADRAGCFGRNLFILALLAMVTLPALAQVVQEKEARDESINRIEVRDGKVYVNGEVVKDLENKDARVVFSRDGDRDLFFFSDDDGTGVHGLALGDRSFSLSPEAHGLRSWVGGDESDALLERYNVEAPLANRFAFFSDGRYEPFAEAFGSNAEIQKLDLRSRELARRLGQADGQQREELNRELTDLLSEIFDKKLADQRERIDRMSNELDELRQKVQERSNAREQIIERRLRQLKGERDVLDW